MILLNLGCGGRTSPLEEVINIDWSPYLRIRKSRLATSVARLFLRGRRRDMLGTLPKNIVAHNLLRGLPFGTSTVDIVYHSHFLEHLDRAVAVAFLNEAKRVLKPGGIHRIVVPDFERLCRAYINHIDSCGPNSRPNGEHDFYIANIIEQCVRREAAATRDKPPARRRLESMVFGDARKRGETHQWMYDRFSLPAMLENLGFAQVCIQDCRTSMVKNWSQYGLDTDADGREHKPGESLYVECVKP